MSGKARRARPAAAGGLREEQRRERRNRILESAAHLFRQRGFEGTAVEEIAEHAAVSPATVYNYFDSKTNIVMALARRHHTQSLPERLRMIERPPKDLLTAVQRFQNLLIDQSLRLLSREIWRTILQALYLEPDGLAHSTAETINTSILENYHQLLTHFQASGGLRRDVDCDALAQVLFSVNATSWRRFVTDESLTLSDLKKTVAGQVALVLDGLAPAPLPSLESTSDTHNDEKRRRPQ